MKSIPVRWIIAALIALFISDGCKAHEIVTLIVPTIADPRDNAVLSCKYDMGNDHLYSTKWYKDDQEIFRYMPAQKPAGLSFSVIGVHLAKQPKCNQVACDLELTELAANSAGHYKCEVSTEAPTFRIVHQNATMTVAALLRRDPLVEGAATSYALGDEIRVNCTSDPSLPPAEVTWYINDQEANYPYLEGASESAPDSKGLSTKTLGLRLRADRSHFLFNASTGGGNWLLRLKCVSAMPSWLPGGSHRRQYTITASLRQPAQLSNQKLKWMGGTATTTSGCPRLLMVVALMFLRAAFRTTPQVVY